MGLKFRTTAAWLVLMLLPIACAFTAGGLSEVEVDFSNYDKLGDPWGSLNCLRMYADEYGSLDASDYTPVPDGSGLKTWCNDGELSAVSSVTSLKSALQAKVGSDRFQVRLQFPDVTQDGDATADMVRFGAMKLHVTYEIPG